MIMQMTQLNIFSARSAAPLCAAVQSIKGLHSDYYRNFAIAEISA